MRALVTILCILVASVFSHGQNAANNFRFAETGEVMWQKVFTSGLTLDQLRKAIACSGVLERPDVFGDITTGNLRLFNVNAISAAYSKYDAPGELINNHLSGFAVIEFREGRYRVTIKKLLLIQMSDSMRPLMEEGGQGQITPLESIAVRRGYMEFRNGFARELSKYLDLTFSRMFDLSEVNADNSW